MNKGNPAPNRIDLTGKVFGRLRVESVSHNEGKLIFWRCVCECGKTVNVRSQSLRVGITKSCGCLQKEVSGKVSRTHGMKNTGTYVTWERMKSRCYNPKDTSYKNYGVRGVSVCDSWRNSFENFYKDMGERPSGMSLDRIDNSKDYSPDNCLWSDRKTQNRNRRNTIVVDVDGKKRVLSELSEEYGIKYSTLYKRIVINGMPPSVAVTI